VRRAGLPSGRLFQGDVLFWGRLNNINRVGEKAIRRKSVPDENVSLDNPKVGFERDFLENNFDPLNSYVSRIGQRSPIRETISSAIAREAVAAGDGAFRTWSAPGRLRIRKSCTSVPSAVIAWARTPA